MPRRRHDARISRVREELQHEDETVRRSDAGEREQERAERPAPDPRETPDDSADER